MYTRSNIIIVVIVVAFITVHIHVIDEVIKNKTRQAILTLTLS